jgi:YidC/Oxa1 family membrane protein insertase
VEFLGQVGHIIMTPLYYLVSAVMVSWHWLLSQALPADAGITWALSIVGLTLVIRAALIPLFVKQINSSRNMQMLQPKVKELQKKYGHDRERLAQETMALYKEAGTNPFASCLPLLVQMPIFLALFRMLNKAAKSEEGHGFLNADLAKSFGQSSIFNHVPLQSSFTSSGGSAAVMIFAGFLVLAMTATTFMTQRQLMSKNMPADAMSGPYAQQQKMLLYVLPVVFAVGGIAFPIGVLLYWTTSNLWTMGQQFYVIRNNPAPGTPAFAAKLKRDQAKGLHTGTEAQPTGGAAAATATAEADETRPAPRQQPKKQTRQQRKKGGGAARPPGSARDSGSTSSEEESA